MPYEGSIQVGNGQNVQVQYKGTFNGKITYDGAVQDIKIQDVLVAFDFICNLFSITKALTRGAELENEKEKIVVKKNNVKIVFGEKIKSGDGFLLGCRITPRKTLNRGYILQDKSQKEPKKAKIPVTTMHMRLGHASEVKTRQTAKKLGVELTGKFDTCQSCAEGKARQKNMSKESEQSKVKGERIYMDLSTVKNKSYGSKHHWVLMVEDYSKYKWSLFLKKKSDLPESVHKLFQHIQNNHDIKFKTIRCDNAGENNKLKEILEKDNYGAKFEFTAPGTPQQNGVVERAFATLYGKMRSMFSWAKFENNMKYGLWAECASTATLLDNMLVEEVTNKSPHEKFFGEMPKFSEHLRVFGEVGVIRKIENKTQPKLENKGLYAIFVGYSSDHSGDVYRMYCPTTRNVRMSRDVRWLNKNYGVFKLENEGGMIRYVYDDDTDPELGDIEVSDDEKNDLEEDSNPPTPSPPKGRKTVSLSTEMRRLDTFYNPTTNTVSWALMSAVNSDYLEPKNFYQAWNHEDPIERENWRGAIQKEFNDMEKREVWTLVKKEEVPKGRKAIGSKWVFKKKKSGVYRARLVALGYNQVPGVDFTDNFSPVTSDTTIKLLLVCMLKNNWSSRMIDIETAFLEGRLQDEIYMNIPLGFLECLGDAHRVIVDMVLKLLGSMYGLVQASRIWYKTICKTLMTDCGMKRCELDICLFYKMTEYGPVVLCVYVDDIFVWALKKELRRLFLS